MPTTLIAWELGGGLGHVGPLRAIAGELFRRGHALRLATANTSLCRQALAGIDIGIGACPRLPPSGRRLKVPCTFADALHDAGYASADAVTAAVGEWLRLIDAVEPDRLLADYSPTAMLAARARGLPTVLIGTGFVCPPDVSPLPSLHPAVTEPHWAEEVETNVLASMNAALAAHGGSPLERVGALVGQADTRLLLTLPELDHYPDRATAPGDVFARLFEALPGAEAAWPERVAGPRVFVYLREGDFVEPLLGGLAAKRIATVAYTPRLPRERAARFAASTVSVHTSPVDLRPLLDGCDVAVHHGGHVSACGLLLAGVPTLTLPMSLEQAVTGRRLRALGAGLDAPSDDLNAIAGALEDLLEDARYAATARAIAARHSPLSARQAVGEAVDAIERVGR